MGCNRKPNKKSKSKSSTACQPSKSYAEARKGVSETIRQHGKSQNTTGNYEGYVRRGKEFLAMFANEGEAANGDIDDGDGDRGAESPDDADNGMDPCFREAFDGPPIKCTPIAIAMFMGYKCIDENLGKSTASGIQAAFLEYYSKLAGDKYRGLWRYDEIRQEWLGNPVRSAEVEDMLEACKNKDGEGERTHSRAMTIQDMKRLYEYIRDNCPDDNGKDGLTVEQIAERGQSLLFNAFASTGFTLWTRNCETTVLRYKDFEFAPNRREGSPENDHGPCWFRVNLRNRKNWQKRMKNGETQLSGHCYKIYQQPKNPEVDMYARLLDWLEFYEKYLLGRPLEPTDFIFPNIGATGVSVHAKKEMSANKAQKMISEMANRANVRGAMHFTTHCFRRGGAQYRFMFAPIGQRWTLARIRWWGGWAKGEHRDTLIRYLLDELYTYEEDHSDALCPFDHQVSLSHAGEHAEIKPLTAAESRALFTEQSLVLEQRFRQLTSLLEPLYARQGMLNHASLIGPGIYPPAQAQQIGSTFTGAIPQPSNIHPSSGVLVNNTYLNSSNILMAGDGIDKGSDTCRKNSRPNTSKRAPSLQNPTHIVPEISRALGAEAWEQVIKDWEEADPLRSLHVALKDWHPDWHKQNKESAKYGQRRLIATEFIIQYSRDKDRFQADYPEHKFGITRMLRAIRSRRQAQGTCLRRESRRTRDQNDSNRNSGDNHE
ncbi:hypothetical protein BDZ97DRAFT_1708433 [Flammula alnicola]|nr:hypothetical protein BDZ97DRAFT_1708433 [Flammula alnicola]